MHIMSLPARNLSSKSPTDSTNIQIEANCTNGNIKFSVSIDRHIPTIHSSLFFLKQSLTTA